MTVSTPPQITHRDRAIARDAERIGKRILSACIDILDAHEVVVADPADVPEGKSLVSLLLHRFSVEAHAYRQSTICADLAEQLRSAAGRGNSNRSVLLRRMAALIDRIEASSAV